MLKWTERRFLPSRLTLRNVNVCGEKNWVVVEEGQRNSGMMHH